MPKQNFKSHAKRKRELAKLDKRQAKDQKRAREEGRPVRRRLRGGACPDPGGDAAARPGSVVAPKAPLTLAEAVERWKNTKVVKAKSRY